jgi:hypothetical protein
MPMSDRPIHIVVFYPSVKYRLGPLLQASRRISHFLAFRETAYSQMIIAGFSPSPARIGQSRKGSCEFRISLPG